MDDLALLWAIRRDEGPLSAEDQRAFEAWLAEDPRRDGALLRAEAALALLDRGRALGALAAPESSFPPRRKVLIGGLAAAAVAATVGMVRFAASPPKEIIATNLGEVLRAPLADGSIATVNTDSRLEVTMGGADRQVELSEGEAWFEVAHDKARPFIVAAGDVRVRAVGTAFSVRRHNSGVDVLVTQGTVEVWRTTAPDDRTLVGRGRRTFIADGANAITAVPAAPEIDRALAWRDGGLALEGEPLDFAVAEINRYNQRKIVIDDPAMGRMSIVGYFDVNDPEGFARSVAIALHANVTASADKIRMAPEGT